MSYDIYCYKSVLGRPDEDEAYAIIDEDEDAYTGDEKENNPAVKLAIVKALVAYNPRLEAFDFDYAEIAKLEASTIEEAKTKFDHIELNVPEGDLAVQLIIYDNYVSINVPYWYKGEEAKQLFEDIKAYIRIIRETAGYFVLDPQTGNAFDPVENGFEGLDKYLSVSGRIEEIVNDQSKAPAKKPWWRFW